MGNRRNVIQALENGRMLLDSLSYPDDRRGHFEIDPDKFATTRRSVATSPPIGDTPTQHVVPGIVARPGYGA